MSPFAHGRDPLCEVCLDEELAQLRGTAHCRGEGWARAIANVIPIEKPWPITERMRATARRKVRATSGYSRRSRMSA